MYAEDEFLALSGIQHFSFCRRQWALIHLEQLWSDNLLTAEGELMHQRAHDESMRERRGDVLIVRGLSVHSSTLGLAGKCDVIEFHKGATGHPLAGEDGLWLPLPVEYKHGRAKINDADRLQLCAQALCLEEMFGCDIACGFLFYGKTKTRERVMFGKDMRTSVWTMTQEMHQLYKRQYTPKVKPFSACKSCSLMEVCLSRAVTRMSVSDYLKAYLAEGQGET